MNLLELPPGDINTVLSHLRVKISHLLIQFIIISDPLKHKSVTLADLLGAGHRMGEHQVQRGVVLHQRMMLVVPNELHHRGERERVREAVLPVVVVNLDQLVVPVFPEKTDEAEHQIKWGENKKTKHHDGTLFIFPAAHRNVSVKSPCNLVEASRTTKEPSGLSLSFSFTSSLREDQLTVNGPNTSDTFNSQTRTRL